nr:hypothetical protein [Jiangella anatolica]
MQRFDDCRVRWRLGGGDQRFEDGFFATQRAQSCAHGGPHVVPDRVAMAGHPDGTAIRSAQGRDPATEHGLGMHVGQHHVPSRAEYSRELGEHRREVTDVGQGQRADDQIGRGGGHRERGQIAGLERGLGHPGARSDKHLRRAVHAEHPVTAVGQQPGDPAGPAGGVQRITGRKPVDDVGDHGLVHIEGGIARLVIIPGPLAVTRDRIHPAHVGGHPSQ